MKLSYYEIYCCEPGRPPRYIMAVTQPHDVTLLLVGMAKHAEHGEGYMAKRVEEEYEPEALPNFRSQGVRATDAQREGLGGVAEHPLG